MTKEEIRKQIIENHPEAEIIRGEPITRFIHEHGFDVALEIISAYAELASEDEENCPYHRRNYAHLAMELDQLLDRVNDFAEATVPEAEEVQE